MNFITILNHLQGRAQKVITIQLRNRPANLSHLRATASPLRLRLIIPTPMSTAEDHRPHLQAIRDMETRPPDLAVRILAITSRPNLRINPEMTITGRSTRSTGGIRSTRIRTGTIRSTRTRTGAIRTMANTPKVRGM